jgi:hypothetical protein
LGGGALRAQEGGEKRECGHFEHESSVLKSTQNDRP